MKKNGFKRTAAFFLFTACISSVSCAGKYDTESESRLIDSLFTGNFSQVSAPTNKSLKKLQNTDEGSVYYTGLYLKDGGDEYAPVSKTYFEYAAKHSPYPYNELSLDELYRLCSNEEKLKILEERLKDEKPSKEKKEKITADKYRLLILLNNFKEAEKLLNISIEDYFASVGIDDEMIKVFNTLKQNYRDTKNTGFIKITQGRILLFNKQYQAAWEIFKPLIENPELLPYLKNRNILSDAGKSALYGSEGAAGYTEAAALFEKKLLSVETNVFNNTPETKNLLTEKYMLAFYAARLNLKTGKKEYMEKALQLFKKAAEYAPSPSDYDNALWYVLDVLKNKNFYSFFEELCSSAPLWKNAYSYENFTAYACMKLLAMEDKKRLILFEEALKKTNLLEARARNAYISARFLNMPEEEGKKLYTNILTQPHNGFYYKALAAYRLNYTPSDSEFLINSLYNRKIKRNQNPDFSSEQAIKILRGLIKYKLYGRIYKTILQIYPQIKVNEAAEFSDILAKNGLYPDSMSVITFAVNSEGEKFSLEDLKLIYPRPFFESVRKYATEYNIPEYVLFALLRSESYFKPQVVSHAGAIGLAQLMKPTAADIARRLKLKNYDLNEPDTNIRMGAFYFANIMRRNGGKIMHAVFAYNAGPNAVKRWLNKSGKLPIDLFLESLEYAETRGYGRNILSASVIYGLLYYDKTYNEIIKELLGE
ncbi:flagellar assembly lytic transglycosylase [Treponema pedis]|uniref:Lytic transglycosylase domain-containing protein n=1 Tax=Treponema pedis TaxID=409322 RepID=A0A7S6WS41_9SPIR|nr:lytic transglycosylase domain-containing protein [Treponema pedis]